MASSPSWTSDPAAPHHRSKSALAGSEDGHQLAAARYASRTLGHIGEALRRARCLSRRGHL